MLRIYADECVRGDIVTALRRAGIDVVTAADQKLLGASDEQHLMRAIQLRRVILSADMGFLKRLDAELQDTFPGCLFVRQDVSTGNAIAAIVRCATRMTPEEMAIHRVIWIK